MNQIFAFFGVMGTFGISLGAYAATPPALLNEQFPDLVEKVLPSVVNISSTTIVNQAAPGMEDFLRFWGLPQNRKQTSLGSGMILDNEGYILTNSHVIENATEVTVVLKDKRQFAAKVIGRDQKMDLAILRIREEGKTTAPSKIEPIKLGDSDKVRIAEAVFAVGNPFGLQHTVTAGIISAKNRTVGHGAFDNFLQTDASINPGNSGGPLFNLKGEVIGINTMIFSRTGQSGGLGFAIPSNEAGKILNDLKRYGRVPRPWLGIVGETINPALARYYNLTAEEGILIYNLIERAPADRAGLRRGDIIVAINGTEIQNPSDVERVLAKQKPTEVINLKIRREKRTTEVRVKLEELPKIDKLPQGIL